MTVCPRCGHKVALFESCGLCRVCHFLLCEAFIEGDETVPISVEEERAIRAAHNLFPTAQSDEPGGAS